MLVPSPIRTTRASLPTSRPVGWAGRPPTPTDTETARAPSSFQSGPARTPATPGAVHIPTRNSLWEGDAPTPASPFYDLWLDYRPVSAPLADAYRAQLQSLVFEQVDGAAAPELASAREELQRGFAQMLGTTPPVTGAPSGAGGLILGTPESSPLIRELGLAEGTGPEGYVIRTVEVNGRPQLVVASEGPRGALYGAFHLLRMMQTGQSLEGVDVRQEPGMALRVVNHWDSWSGGTERGYAGESVFDFEGLPKIEQRYIDYARYLASTGVNTLVVNNVNAEPKFLETESLDKLAALAGVFRAYGIKLQLSVSWDAPRVLDGLTDLDPLNPQLQAWWDAKAREVLERIPDFGGFLVKADSEGQPGPKQYGRDHAQGANMFARALRRAAPERVEDPPLVMWRAFVWHREGGDRAKNAFDEFAPLDGKFDSNAILQIKHGPLDFQVREPVSPLLAALPNTRVMLELQLTQEYTGQATHVAYLPTFWKNEVYDFDIDGAGPTRNVGELVEGVAGVRNVGWDPKNPNWTGHPLAAANTYAYGRLAWDPAADPAALAEEWVRMTFGEDPEVVRVTTGLLNGSWKNYEDYTSPLGVGFMCEGWKEHFDPLPEVKQDAHRSDAEGVGYDRVSSGYLDQYPPEVAALYRDPATCPDELLLFFHHVPYHHVLHSGKTVIEHIYDSHFEGVREVEAQREAWRSLAGRMPAAQHQEVLRKLDAQVEHARFWRDSIVGYYLETSGRQDAAREWLAVRRITMKDGQAVVRLVNNSPGPVQVQLRVDSNGVQGSTTVTVPPSTEPGKATRIVLPVSSEQATGTPQFQLSATDAQGHAIDLLGPTEPMVVTRTGDLEPWRPAF